MGAAVAFSFSFFVSTLGPNTLQSCLWAMPVGMELWTYEFALGSTGKHWKKNPIGIKGGRLAPIWFQQMQKRGIKPKSVSSTKMALVTLHGDFGLSSLAFWGLQERRMLQPAENLGLAGLAVSAANVRAVQGLERVSIQQNTSKYYPVVITIITYCCILIMLYSAISTYNHL